MCLHYLLHHFSCVFYKNSAFGAHRMKNPRISFIFQSTKIMKENLVNLLCFIYLPKFDIKRFYYNRVHL